MVAFGLLRRVSCLMAIWAACVPPALASPSLSDEWASWESERKAAYYRDLPGEMDHLEHMVHAARLSGDRHRYWMALGRLLDGASALLMLPAASWAREAAPQVEEARASGDVLGLGALLMGLSNFELRDGRQRKAREMLEEVRVLAERQRVPALRTSADVALGFMLVGLGDVAHAVPLFQHAGDAPTDALSRVNAQWGRMIVDFAAAGSSQDNQRMLSGMDRLLEQVDVDQAFYMALKLVSEKGYAYFRLRKAQEALALYEAWAEKARRRGLVPERDPVLATWAMNTYAGAKRWRECRDIAQAIAMPDRTVSRMVLLTRRAVCKAELKDRSALQDIEDLERLAPALAETPAWQETAWQSIERAYAGLGEHAKAYAAALKTRDATARRVAAANDLARHEAEAKYDLAAKDKENALLKASEALQTQRRNALAAGLALAALALTVVAMLLRKQMRQRRRLAELSQSLQASNTELTHLNASRTRLLAAACHDLRQPAHALGLLAETAVQQTPAQARAPLEGMRRCSNALSDMLDMLLDMTQLEADRYRPVVAAFALSEVLEALKAQFMPLAARKGLALDIADTAAVVRSDRHLVQRMLMNLVSNAIKYTHEGQVVVRVHESEGQARVTVRDTGPGIPPERQEQVFGEYVRLDANGPVEGLGIGLPIVKRAAELLGHDLRLSSTVGEGTQVALTLPLASDTVQAQQAGTAVQGLGRLVGVIDDDENIREATLRLLQAHGFRAVAAGDAQGLQQKLAREGLEQPRLVITDLHLGADRADGLQGLQALRRQAGWADVRVLLLTGDLAPDVASQAAALRVALAYKPVQPRKLLWLIEQILTASDSPAPEAVPAAAAG